MLLLLWWCFYVSLECGFDNSGWGFILLVIAICEIIVGAYLIEHKI
jgi:hypothetical protein